MQVDSYSKGQLVSGTNCAALETDDQGCGIRVLEPNSFGSAFNGNNGGVYASVYPLSSKVYIFMC